MLSNQQINFSFMLYEMQKFRAFRVGVVVGVFQLVRRSRVRRGDHERAGQAKMPSLTRRLKGVGDGVEWNGREWIPMGWGLCTTAPHLILQNPQWNHFQARRQGPGPPELQVHWCTFELCCWFILSGLHYHQ